MQQRSKAMRVMIPAPTNFAGDEAEAPNVFCGFVDGKAVRVPYGRVVEVPEALGEHLVKTDQATPIP